MSVFAPAPSRAASHAGRLALLLLFALAGCASPAPRLQAGEIGTIAGQQTAGLGEEEARRKVLATAARLTVDHGYRYFIILPATGLSGANAAKVNSTANSTMVIHAGQAQRFQIVHRATGRDGIRVWDAYSLLTRRTTGN